MFKGFRHSGAGSLQVGGVILTCVLLTPVSAAASERQHDAHEHGRATMNVAVEGRNLEIEFVSPSANIVGFEHKATSEADQKSVRAAIATLKDTASLFAFPADAGCRLHEAEVESGQLEDGHHDDKEHGHDKKGHGHGDKEHGHDKKGRGHKEHRHDEKGHGHAKKESEHDHEETHSEFHAHYHFSCQTPAAVKYLDVLLLKRFPAIEELDVRAVGPNGQTSKELTHDTTRLTF